MIIEIDDHSRETYVLHKNPGSLSIQFENQKAHRMTEPTLNPTESKGKRGIRVFKPEETFGLTYNAETGHYDLSFEGRAFPIRFVAPGIFFTLINPLAAGMKHKSGRHNFTLEFEGDRLVSIINDDVDAAEGEVVPRTSSVSVRMDSPIKDWIKVIAELPVEKALRLK